jgi:hypothetical protein
MVKNKTILEFLDSQLPAYINPMGVQFYLNANSTITICANYPGIKQLPKISLELMQEVPSLGKINNFLQFTRWEQILELNSRDLLKLYESGRMNVLCRLQLPQLQMSFRKTKNGLMGKDIYGSLHKVGMPLSSPTNFISYTLHFYRDAIGTR